MPRETAFLLPSPGLTILAPHGQSLGVAVVFGVAGVGGLTRWVVGLVRTMGFMELFGAIGALEFMALARQAEGAGSRKRQ